jgi:hypothetical protein
MKPFVLPFRHGDVVKYIGPHNTVWKVKQEHIIDYIMRGVNSWSYSTNCGAWIPHEDFELVRECNAESIAKLYEGFEDEDE